MVILIVFEYNAIYIRVNNVHLQVYMKEAIEDI